MLSWLMGHGPRIVPLVGVSTISQLEEVLEATDLILDPQDRALLDTAGHPSPLRQ